MFRSENVKHFQLNGITFDFTKLTTLQIRNENHLGCLFYMYNFILNSSVKNLVSGSEYVNAKNRKDGGYMKMGVYLGIRLLAQEICLRPNTQDIFFYRTQIMEPKFVFRVL